MKPGTYDNLNAILDLAKTKKIKVKLAVKMINDKREKSAKDFLKQHPKKA